MSSQSQMLFQSENAAPRQPTPMPFDNTDLDFTNIDLADIMSHGLESHFQPEDDETEDRVQTGADPVGATEQNAAQSPTQDKLSNQRKMQLQSEAVQQVLPEFQFEPAATDYPTHFAFEDSQSYQPPMQFPFQHLVPSGQTQYQFGATAFQQPLFPMPTFGSPQYPLPMWQYATQLDMPSNPVPLFPNVPPPINQPSITTRTRQRKEASGVFTTADGGFVNMTVAPTQTSPRRKQAKKKIPWIWDIDGPDKSQQRRLAGNLLGTQKSSEGFIAPRLPGGQGAIEYVGSPDDHYAINISERQCRKLGIKHVRMRKRGNPIVAPNPNQEELNNTMHPLLNVPQNFSNSHSETARIETCMQALGSSTEWDRNRAT